MTIASPEVMARHASGRGALLWTATRLRHVFASAAKSPTWSLGTALLATIILMPAAAVAVMGLQADGETWRHLSSTILPLSLFNTALLLLGAGALALAAGTGAAWLITMYRFPGRWLADRLLVLPLAMPVYIVAYAYVELLDYAGPVQSELRSLLGYKTAAAYFFPDVRSLGGAILVFASTFYPYVYLSARAAFVQQSICILEVARTLGCSPFSAFRTVALPIARPALAAGAILVAMECLNDLGAVQYLGVETLAASVYATWLQRGSLSGAAQIASVVLVLVLVLLVLERTARRGATHDTTGRYRAIPFESLSGWHGGLALVLALLPALAGFFVPASVLCAQALHQAKGPLPPDFVAAAENSLMLAALTSLCTVAVALFFGYAARIARSPVTAAANRVASSGYALPGTVLAIGLMIPLAAFDNRIDAWMRATFGHSTGLLLSGSLFAVTLALVMRFLAVAVGSIDAGLARISPNLDAAGRALGARAPRILFQVHMPMLAPALGAAALLVFVDAMKELPATLLLRPFNFETLATYVYGLAAAERFEEAALGALSITLIGLIPVLLLHQAIASGRTGGRGRAN